MAVALLTSTLSRDEVAAHAQLELAADAYIDLRATSDTDLVATLERIACVGAPTVV